MHATLVSARTAPYSFAAISPKLNALAVQPGIPVVRALEYASAVLDACMTQAHAVADSANGREEENKAWATVYLLETVQALLGSSISGLRGEG